MPLRTPQDVGFEPLAETHWQKYAYRWSFSHTDFEQASLALEGTYVHHMRWPWTPDMTTWKDDTAAEMASPSVLVIPPKVIHTSRNVGGPGFLVDIFSPPRLDFSAKPGLVCNADEYPLPAGVDLSAYANASAA